MGIIKFNNVPSTTPGLEVETFPNYVAPEKEYQVTHVPGRNGDLVVDTKTYKNVPRSYKVSMAVEPPAVSVSGSTASFEATAERALAECKTAISSDVGKTGTTIINSVTDPVENNEPYNFRAVPNGVGDRENDTLIGGTVAWNQLVQNGNFASTTGWAVGGQANFTVSNNIANLTPTAQWGRIQQTNIPFITNHKYLVCFEIKGKPTTYSEINGTGRYLTGTDWNIFKKIIVGDSTKAQIITFGESGTSDFVTINIKNVNIIDLTQMFGSTIADYIYGLETATAGAGVAWFRNLFPKDYYAYNAGELISVKTEAHKMVGFNQFDKSTAQSNKNIDANGNLVNGSFVVSDFIPVIPSTMYYFKNIESSYYARPICEYDKNKKFIGDTTVSASSSTHSVSGRAILMNNCYYIRIIISPSSIDTCCIDLSDASKNGTYEPYEEHIYPLNPALELRGIPKLNSSNKLYYDGDIYSSDGSVIRKYGIVDLGTLNWGFNGTAGHQYFSTTDITNIKVPSSLGVVVNGICSNYTLTPYSYVYDNTQDKIIGVSTSGRTAIYDTGTLSMTAEQFKTAMSGVYLIYELATPVIESTTGLIDNVSIASFDDGADNVPVNLLESEIVAVQDLHGYDKPWAGGAGKNKAYTNEGNNLVIADVKANTTYTFSCKHVETQYNYGINLKKNNSTGEVLISDSNNPTSLTFTPTDDCSVFINAYSYTSGVLVSNIIKKYQVELGSTATSYAPYSNICPISGHTEANLVVCNKNLYEPTTASQIAGGITCTNNNDGTYTCSNQATQLQQFSLGTIKLPAGTYVLSGCPIGGSLTTFDLRWTNSYIDKGSGVIITSDGNTKSHVVITIRNGYNCGSGITFKPMICKVDTPNPDYAHFEKKSATTYTFTFGQTVYGGYFDNKGNLVVTHGYHELTGSEGWSWGKSSTFSGGFYMTVGNVGAKARVPFICTHAKTALTISEYEWGTCFCDGSLNFRIMQASDTVEDWKTYLANQYANGTPVTICYELATPITLAITSQDIPTLLGKNNVFANTGNIKTLSYPKQVCPFEPAQEVDDHGTEEYIDNREVAIPVGHESKYFTAGKIYNFSWLDEAGLIKEGELNADTGVLTITNGYGIVDLGSLSWNKDTSHTEYAFYGYSTDIPKCKNTGLSSVNYYGSCDQYLLDSVYNIDRATNDKRIGVIQHNIGMRVWITDSSYTDAATFKSAMHGVKLLYELADPVRTIQLTPVQVESLIGHNILISESGNISVTPRTYSTYTEKMNAISDWLHSASGYARLEDTYEPDYYRKAYYNEQADMENIFDEAGRATLKFVCKPQRYLKSGEEPITISSGGLIQNRTRYEAYPILKVTTNNTQGSVAIGNHSITIKAGAGTDPITIDCELQDAWSGTSNKNSYIVLTDGEFPVIDPGTQTVTFDGGVQSVEVIPRWWTV